jgi:hypothetical protein
MLRQFFQFFAEIKLKVASLKLRTNFENPPVTRFEGYKAAILTLK